MISAKARDMNRSRDVKGPELKRPYDDYGGHMGGKLEVEGLDDYADTGTLSKHNLSDLHQGDHEVPLRASGQQAVVVPAPMGHSSSMGNYKPNLAKGSTKDQAHHGGGQDMYPQQSASVGRHSEGGREAKGMGRSVAKKMAYAAKKKGY